MTLGGACVRRRGLRGRGTGCAYRATSFIRNYLPPQDHRRALGIGLLQGPRGWHFLMSEVALQRTSDGREWGPSRDRKGP